MPFDATYLIVGFALLVAAFVKGATGLGFPLIATPTLIAVVFLGGVQLIGLGVLGEYLGRIYNEVRGRPVSIIKKLTNTHVSSKAES